MKKNLTSVFVESARVPKGHKFPQIDYWDTWQKGFGLRVATDRKSWIVMYRYNGRKVRHTFDTYPHLGVADARTKAKELIGQVAGGRDPAAEKIEHKMERRDAESFGALAEDFLAEFVSKKRSSTQL